MKKNKPSFLRARTALALGCLASLAACGGGGSASNPPAAPPAPAITANLSSAKARPNESVSIMWSASNASSCAIPELAASGLAASGSRAIVPTAGGRFTYTVSCTGAGGSATQTLTLIVPMPVYATSYENYKLVNLPATQLPMTSGKHFVNIQLFNTRAYADFEQAGRYSYLSMPLDGSYLDADPVNRGLVSIFRLNADGSSTDISAELIEGSRTGCVHPRKAVVADFNADGVPDVFFACHGSEAPSASPAQRVELPMMLWSQPNGRFRLETLALADPIYVHGAAAADINGDGYPDIVLADISQNARGRSPVWSLINNRDGTFSADHGNFPGLSGKGIWSVEFVKVAGQTYLWLSGNDASTLPFEGHTQALYSFDATGRFNPNAVQTLPEMPSHALPLDISVNGAKAYVLRVNPQYNGYAVQQIDLNLNTGAQFFSYSGPDFGSNAGTNPACAGVGGTWIDWLRIHNGRLISDDACRSPNLQLPD